MSLPFIRLCILRATRILSAYVDDKQYSVELVGAVSPSLSAYDFMLIMVIAGHPPRYICKENVRLGMDWSRLF